MATLISLRTGLRRDTTTLERLTLLREAYMKIGRTASQIRTDARAKVRAATSSKSKEDRRQFFLTHLRLDKQIYGNVENWDPC